MIWGRRNLSFASEIMVVLRRELILVVIPLEGLSSPTHMKLSQGHALPYIPCGSTQSARWRAGPLSGKRCSKAE